MIILIDVKNHFIKFNTRLWLKAQKTKNKWKPLQFDKMHL